MPQCQGAHPVFDPKDYASGLSHEAVSAERASFPRLSAMRASSSDAASEGVFAGPRSDVVQGCCAAEHTNPKSAVRPSKHGPSGAVPAAALY